MPAAVVARCLLICVRIASQAKATWALHHSSVILTITVLLLQIGLWHVSADLMFEPGTQQHLVLAANQSEIIQTSLRLKNNGDSSFDIRLQAQCDNKLRYAIRL